jgi:nitroimidazol reductase NimA-like FMN-containing flavoprotein (pyridoxamine 5'-phosphate oxidase superfamily)
VGVPTEAQVRGKVEDGLEALSIAECERRLRTGGVGILALCGVEAPVLRPVNFAVHENWVLIRTGEGQILEAAQGAEPASFVISETDRLEHAGWSVVVTGKLAERSSLGEIEKIPLRPWARTEKHHFVGLSIEEVSGRRLAARSGTGPS